MESWHALEEWDPEDIDTEKTAHAQELSPVVPHKTGEWGGTQNQQGSHT